MVIFAALALLAAAGAPSDALAGGDGVRAVSAGRGHTCVARVDLSAWCWGHNEHAELGSGSTSTPLDPVRVRQRVVNQVVEYLEGVKAVSAGGDHSCALKTDGTVWCWGYSFYGQTGDGTGSPTSWLRLEPVQVRRGSGFLTGITAISAGKDHTCARRSDGTAWCWGDGGRVGDYTMDDRPKAVKVRRLDNTALTGVTHVNAGADHTCARRNDGTAWCWGWAETGQVGDGTTGDATNHFRTYAVQVRRGSGYLTNVTDITAGGVHSCARRGDGTAWCWGFLTGDGTPGVRLKAVQVRRGSGYLTNVTRIEAGYGHTCARRGDGTAWCWGAASDGQVGDGTLGDSDGLRLKARRVVTESGASLTGVRAVSGGGKHSCASRTDGTAWCWGLNDEWQVGSAYRVRVVWAGQSGSFVD